MQLRKENQWLILSIDGKGQVVILKDANGHHGHRRTNAGADMMAVISSMSDCDQYWWHLVTETPWMEQGQKRWVGSLVQVEEHRGRLRQWPQIWSDHLFPLRLHPKWHQPSYLWGFCPRPSIAHTDEVSNAEIGDLCPSDQCTETWAVSSVSLYLLLVLRREQVWGDLRDSFL